MKVAPQSWMEIDLRSAESLAGLNLAGMKARGAVFYGLDMKGVRLQGAP